MCLLLDVGEGLLCSGADIRKIESMFNTMGKTYNIHKMSAFVIPSLISLTIQLDDGFGVTQSRRIPASNITTNLFRLNHLNNISHICRHRRMSLDELQQMIDESFQPVKAFPFYFGTCFAIGSLAFFFGGNVWDSLVAITLAIVICFIKRNVAEYIDNNIALSFLCALVIGTAAELLGSWFGVLDVDKILIADIMCLIPGIAVTLSVRDIIVGDTITGILRLTEGIFITGALAFGFWLSHWIIGG